VSVGVGVFVGVRVGVSVGVLVGVLVGVRVGVSVGVFVAVLVGVCVGVCVGVAVGAFTTTVPSTRLPRMETIPKLTSVFLGGVLLRVKPVLALVVMEVNSTVRKVNVPVG
jgi:hypothetical protein